MIAVDTHFLPPSSEEEKPEIATLTVSVTTEEATLLSYASREGKISWLLRNPDDRGRPRRKPRLRAGGTPLVEIWKAGIREEKSPVPFKVREHE